MKVKMKVQISGTRNGESWPIPGTDVELPDAEAAKYCANGLAIPVRSDEDDVEKRAPAKKETEASPAKKSKPAAATG